MAHFDIPLDLPHAGRLASRIQRLLEKHCEELNVDAPDALDIAEELDELLFKYTATEENPPEAEAQEVREQAAELGRQLVDALERAQIAGDRLGQFIRNLFRVPRARRRGRGDLAASRGESEVAAAAFVVAGFSPPWSPTG